MPLPENPIHTPIRGVTQPGPSSPDGQGHPRERRQFTAIPGRPGIPFAGDRYYGCTHRTRQLPGKQAGRCRRPYSNGRISLHRPASRGGRRPRRERVLQPAVSADNAIELKHRVGWGIRTTRAANGGTQCGRHGGRRCSRCLRSGSSPIESHARMPLQEFGRL